MPRLERWVAIMIALCAVVVSSIAFAEDGKTQTVQTQNSGQVSGQNFLRDSWFAVSIAGTKCGWMHEKFQVLGDRIQTSNDIRLTLGRAGASTTVRIGWKFTESSDGTPIECEVQQESGSEVSRTIYRFSKTEIAVDETAGGRTLSRKMPYPEEYGGLQRRWSAISTHAARRERRKFRIAQSIHRVDCGSSIWSQSEWEKAKRRKQFVGSPQIVLCRCQLRKMLMAMAKSSYLAQNGDWRHDRASMQ